MVFPGFKNKISKIFPFVTFFIVVLALFLIHNLLQHYSYREITNEVGSIPREKIGLAILGTFLSFFVLSFYDVLGLKYVEVRVSFLRTLVTSFTAFAISNSIGLASLAGGSIRLRFYSRFSVETNRILSMIAFIAVSFWLGYLAIAGATILFFPLELPAEIHVPKILLQVLGGLFVLVPFAYVVLCSFNFQTQKKIGPFEFKFPSLKIAIPQVLVGVLDWTLAGSILYFLMPDDLRADYFPFLSIYLTAQLVSLISHVPGGFGILEALLIYFLTPEHQTTPAIVASLVAFRVIYYLIPMLVAAGGFVAVEAYAKRHLAKPFSRVAIQFSRLVVPDLITILVFVGGVILLISGSTPPVHSRLLLLSEWIPLGAIEASHFLGSCIGITLLILARSLASRSHAAWLLTVCLAIAGALVSLAKGLDYEEASLLIVLAGILFVSRSEFDRPSNLFSESFSPSWIVAILTALVGAIWLGVFSHKHVEYANELWWTFELKRDAPRFLRASVAAGATAFAISLFHLLQPPSNPKESEDEQLDLKDVLPLLAQSNETMSQLVLLGDKKVFFSKSRKSFLMYAIQGSSWIVLGDPIGQEDDFEEALYEFKGLADRYRGEVVFYEASAKDLPLYIDFGYNFAKIGEEAKVPLEDFNLEGGAKKSIRQVHTKYLKQNLEFAIVEREKFNEIEDEIRQVSNVWMMSKNTREKGFSLGYFDPDYLRNFRTAVIRKEGKIIAFANLWETQSLKEVSVDLMRYDPAHGSGLLEHLIIHVMFWSKSTGYKMFNLGMAPLSGLETGRFSSRWNHVARLIYAHGERFYNFQGLRAYKEKFDPIWEPRYLAYSSKLTLPIVLANIAVLISGGVKGVIGR